MNKNVLKFKISGLEGRQREKTNFPLPRLQKKREDLEDDHARFADLFVFFCQGEINITAAEEFIFKNKRGRENGGRECLMEDEQFGKGE